MSKQLWGEGGGLTMSIAPSCYNLFTLFDKTWPFAPSNLKCYFPSLHLGQSNLNLTSQSPYFINTDNKIYSTFILLLWFLQ